jgi:hypothetical protein
MKLKSILRTLPYATLEEILEFWKIQPPTLDEELGEKQRQAIVADYLYPRLQNRQFFESAYAKLAEDEKDAVYFLAIHGGDLEKEEVLERFFGGDTKTFDALVGQLTARGFVFIDDLSDEEVGAVLVGLPEPYLRYIELPSYWEGYLGNFLKDLSTQQLKTMAHTGMRLHLDSVKKNFLLSRIRKFLLNPAKLKEYISSLPSNERQVFNALLERKGICVYRDLLDVGYQKRYDHSKADYINNLLAISGLVFTAVPKPNKYNNLLMIPRDIYYIIENNFKPDRRSLKDLDTVSLPGRESPPTIVLDNSNSLLRDIVIFVSFINRNAVKTLSSGGIGKNDLKKILPLLSANKTVKYASFIALFLISKKFIIGVGGQWKVSNTFIKWLEDSQQCYQDIFQHWFETSEWNEEFIDGNTVHTEAPPNNLVNGPEMRKLVLKNIEIIPHDRWIDFGAFVESLLPQIEINIPKRGSQLVLERNNRPNAMVVESIVGEAMYWLGLVTLGLTNIRDLERLGNRLAEVPESAAKRIKGEGEQHLKFFFKLTDLGSFVLEGLYLEPQKLFERQSRDVVAPLKYDIMEFTVQPNLEVITPPDLNLKSFYHLNEFANINTVDVMSTLNISKESLREGMDKGLRGEDILKFLTESSRQRLPDTVRHLISECSDKHGEVNMGSAGGYIVVDDPILLEELKSQKRIRSVIKDIVDDKLILLDPDVNVKKLAKELQRLGFMPQLESEQVHLTTEGRYHFSLTKEDLYYLLGALQFILAVENDLGTSLTDDRVAPLLERLKPDTKSSYNLTFYAETIAKGFHKKFQSAMKKKMSEATTKYKKQISRLLTSTSPRAPSKYSFPGPNPSSKKADVRSMIDFAIDNTFELEIKYLKASDEEVEEVVEPESVDNDKLYAYCEKRDSYSVYRLDRIQQTRLL